MKKGTRHNGIIINLFLLLFMITSIMPSLQLFKSFEIALFVFLKHRLNMFLFKMETCFFKKLLF